MTTCTHPIAAIGSSQCDRILARLREANGSWVPMPELVACSNSYVIATRVSELRKKGHQIDCKIDREEGAAHSSYRIVEGGL